MISVRLDSKIRIQTDKLSNDQLSELKRTFRYNNPDYFKKMALGLWVGNTPKLIPTFEFVDNGQTITFLKGSLSKIVEFLDKNNLEYVINDNRNVGPFVDFAMDPTFILRDYQEEAVQKAVEAQCGMVEGAAGSGKTEIALALAARLGLRTAVMVHDTNLMNQWIERINKRLGIPIKEIGQFGGGKKKLGKKITVIMYQTARNNMHRLSDYFGVVLADEIHHAPSTTFLETLRQFNAKYMYGFSATIKRQDLKHFVSYDLFGPIIYTIKRQDLVDQGYLTDVQMHVVFTDYYYDFMNEDQLRELDDEGILSVSDMTVKDKKNWLSDNGFKHKDYNHYLNTITFSVNRTNKILKYVIKEYNNNATSIIFVKRREYCKVLQEALQSHNINSVILWGSSSKSEKQEIKDNLKLLKDGKVKIGIGTVLDEGIDLPRIDVGFITYRNSTHPGQQEQQAGRLARLFEGKDCGKLYYFYDNCVTKFQGDLKDIKSRFKNLVIHASKIRPQK